MCQSVVCLSLYLLYYIKHQFPRCFHRRRARPPTHTLNGKEVKLFTNGLLEIQTMVVGIMPTFTSTQPTEHTCFCVLYSILKYKWKPQQYMSTLLVQLHNTVPYLHFRKSIWEHYSKPRGLVGNHYLSPGYDAEVGKCSWAYHSINFDYCLVHPSRKCINIYLLFYLSLGEDLVYLQTLQ